MADDIKALTKRVAQLEKQLKQLDTERRLRFAEDRIKVLTDSLTSSKDIEKILEAYYRRMSADPQFSNKVVMREYELSEKAREARDREYQKDMDRYDKELMRMSKETASEAQIRAIEMRLTSLEAQVSKGRK
ncbi:MAG: hypothetical protein CML68_08630 [Rhodobacteraceae bacterium]|nr:hypothetical protein [Paracoccaceae bacterium]